MWCEGVGDWSSVGAGLLSLAKLAALSLGVQPQMLHESAKLGHETKCRLINDA